MATFLSTTVDAFVEEEHDGMGGYSMPIKCRWPTVLKESVKSTKLWNREFCCVRVIMSW